MALTEQTGVLLFGGEYLGEVAGFDEASGLGTIAFDCADGGGDLVRLGFHCTQIADGSRSIDRGVKVRFRVMPVNLGLLEASSIERR